MVDHGRPVAFGVFPVPYAADLENLWAAVRLADDSGLDLIGIQDHPYQRRFLDTMTLLTAVAVRTRRVSVFPDVACLPLRPPAMLAGAAATIDLLSGGRFELGLGAGGFWDAIAAMDGPRRRPAAAITALREAIEVIRLMWRGEGAVHYEGEHYRLAGVKPGPRPAHDIGIWLGVYGPRAVRLVGELADGWVPSLPRFTVAELAERSSMIDEAAVAAGRSPADIRRVANINGVITDGSSEGFLRGPSDQWVSELGDLALEHAVDTFVLWPDGDLLEQTGRFADVAQATRAAVDSERGRHGPGTSAD